MLEFINWTDNYQANDLFDYAELHGLSTDNAHEDSYYLIRLHAKFLSKKPELKHFIRVGENGEILEEPVALDHELYHIGTGAALKDSHNAQIKAWEKAGADLISEEAEIIIGDTFDEIVFKGVTVASIWTGVQDEYQMHFKTIEDVIRQINQSIFKIR